MTAVLIAAAQRVEHYEIAVSTTVRSIAETVGVDDQASHLEDDLEEDKCTDQKLTELPDQYSGERHGNEQQDEELARRKEVQSSSVMCHTEGVFASFRARRFILRA